MIKYISADAGVHEFDKQRINEIEDAINIAASKLSDIGEKFNQEALFCITIGARNEVITVRIMALGTYNTVPISPHEICKQAVRDDARKVLILHNHPDTYTNNLAPSNEDIAITDRLLYGLSILNISLLDHLIVSDNYLNDKKFYSMRNNQVLDFNYYFKLENIKPMNDVNNLSWDVRR